MSKANMIRGFVRDGRGEARGFTQLAWVREQFRAKFGFDPYPGTLNVQVRDPAQLVKWRERAGIPIEPSPGYCAATCFRATVNSQVAAVWLIPAVANYPQDVIELMASVSLRATLNLRAGDEVSIELEGGE